MTDAKRAASTEIRVHGPSGVDLSDNAQWREIEHDRRRERRLVLYGIVAMSIVCLFVVVRLLFF